jgi:hypothetical protein
MSDSTSVLATLLLTSNQAAKEAAANNLFNSASPAMLYAINPATTTGLTFGYIGGRLDGTAVSNGTVTLTDATTNYVVANRTTGAVSVSTATTNWNNQTDYARLYKVVTASGAISSYEDHRTTLNPAPAGSPARELQVACSDITTALTTGTGKAVFRAPRAMNITGVRASLATAQTGNGGGGIFTVDINEGDPPTSILSTKLTIDNGEKTSTTAATPAVISDSSIADDELITIDIDQVGDGTAKGLVVTILYT